MQTETAEAHDAMRLISKSNGPLIFGFAEPLPAGAKGKPIKRRIILSEANTEGSAIVVSAETYNAIREQVEAEEAAGNVITFAAPGAQPGALAVG